MKKKMNKILLWLNSARKSWVLWINSIAGTLIIMLPELEAALPSLADKLPMDVYKWLAVGLAVTNLALRAKTNKALGAK